MMNSEIPPRTSSSRRPPTTISLSPSLCSVAEVWWSRACICWSIWWSILSDPPFAGIGLLRTSTVLVLLHHVDLCLEHHILHQQALLLQAEKDNDGTFPPSLSWPTTVALTSASSPSSFPLLNTTAWWLGVLIMVSGMLLILMVAAYPTQQQEWLLATALLSLFCLEALLPIIVMGCTSLWFLKQVSWVTTLGLLGILWSVVTLLAHWIRCSLYQNLGHG